MKKIMAIIIALGLLAISASGCAKEETPVPNDSATVAQPSVSVLAAKADAAALAAQEAASVLKAKADAAASAAQEAASALKEKTETAMSTLQGEVKSSEDLPTVGGVTSAVQSSTQALIRQGNAIAGGVTSAAQASSQDAALKEGLLEEKTVSAESSAAELLTTTQQTVAGAATAGGGDVANPEEETVSDSLSGAL